MIETQKGIKSTENKSTNDAKMRTIIILSYTLFMKRQTYAISFVLEKRTPNNTYYKA